MQSVFSYPLIVAELSSARKEYKINATEEQNKYIAEVLKIEAIKKLNVDFSVKYDKKAHILSLLGRIDVDTILKSVISLDNFNKSYSFGFEKIYDTKMSYDEQKELVDKGLDFPDIIENGSVDVVDVIIEQLVFHVDEHPRQDGEEFEFKPKFDEELQDFHNPFKILAKIK